MQMRHVKENNGVTLYQMEHKSNVKKPITLLSLSRRNANIMTTFNNGL